MSSATPETMEEKVSSIIEGACSKMKYLRHQTSKSTFSHSYVQLEFDKAADMEVISFELSQILRRIYQQFPLGASFPEIIPYSIENLSINKPLLIYSVNANAQPSEIRNAIEGIFQKSFVTIKNIGRIELTGSNKPVIILKIDSRRCESWGITSDNLASQLKRLNQVSFHGFLSENENQYAILNVPQQFSIEGFKEIPIKTNRNTIVRLKDFASISIEDDKPTEYLRVNGKTSIFINIYG
ncbi:MAG: cation/multidrug efflux, partial [Chitinophagaceae bacterium]